MAKKKNNKLKQQNSEFTPSCNLISDVIGKLINVNYSFMLMLHHQNLNGPKTFSSCKETTSFQSSLMMG